MHRPEECEGAKIRDRREVRDRIVGWCFARARHIGHRTGCAKVDRMAVGRRANDLLRRNGAIGTRAVLNDHGLADRVR